MSHSEESGSAVTNPPMIEVVDAVKRFGDNLALDGVSLSADAERTVVLLGPSGCGKTTLLRAIAGLEQIDSGSISIAGRQVSGAGVTVPPEQRNVGLVFQDWALFPHMTVGDNVAYGIAKGADRAQRVAEVLDMVGLSGMATRMPTTLSGGQQQRVALARSLAPRPTALLLDEPFSNLDTTLRSEVRSEVHALLLELGVTAVFVTHDQEEAFVLGDRVAVMRDGVIEQFASPAEVYSQPANPWIASFVGQTNLFSAVGQGETAATPIGDVTLDRSASGPITVLVRPEDLEVHPLGSETASAVPSSGRSINGVTGTVELVEYHGHDHLLYVSVDSNHSEAVDVKTRLAGAPTLRRGDRVRLTVNRPAIAFDRS